ncbi:cyclic nucleotide-binding domain-containing protein [Candidatus Gracilibacteria bacterium]|nr:cyclic nucleotide-binding domain-containing protein [Candidatus Gracilibacteria bacterium]
MADSRAFLEPILDPNIKLKKPVFDRKLFFTDYGAIDENGIKKEHDFTKDIISINEIIFKLIEKSYFFKGLDNKIIISAIKKKRINIIELKKGIEIINESDHNCDVFYVLLRGKLGIYRGKNKHKHKICIIDKISVIGEIGFINPEIKRTATVITEEKSFLMRFDRVFIDNLSENDQLKIYKNFAREISSKVMMSTEIIHNYLKGGNGGDIKVTEDIENKIKDLVFHTVE